MANAPGTLESLAAGIVKIILPVEDRLISGQVLTLLAELDIDLPGSLDGNAAFESGAERTATSVRQMLPLLVELVQKIEAEDFAAALPKGLSLALEIKGLVDNATALADAIKAAGPFPDASGTEIDELPQRILDYLVIRHTEGVPAAAELFEFFGVFTREPKTVGSLEILRRRIAFDQLGNLMSSPAAILETLYGWGTAGFDGQALLEKLQKLLNENGLPAILDTTTSPPVLDVMFVEIQADTSTNPPGLVLSFSDSLSSGETPTFSQEQWSVALELDTEIGAGFVLRIQPDGTVSATPPSGQIAGDNQLVFTAGSASGPPFVVIGQADGSRVEAQQFVAKLGAGFAWDSASSSARGQFSIAAEVRGGKVVIDFSQGDGFINTLLSGVHLESDFDVGIGYSSEDGLFFNGSSSLLVQLPIHIDLSVIEIKALTLEVGIEGREFPIGIAVDVNGNLGPLQLAIEQIGIEARLSIPEDRSGNLGPLDLEIGFKPPVGVGIAIDAGIVSGGGYLRIDPDRGEYAGVLELSFAGLFSLTAIGLITTRMPDGSDGFSLLVIMSVEFNPGIQLGYGFTLLGVGGLLGLNRTMILTALADGVRSGSLTSVMFPQDVVANAPTIINNLRNYFPPEQDVFLIGPMGKLGYGTPTLISVTIGVIVEVPGNIAIIGIIAVVLPDAAAPLLVLQVQFIGAIEFDKSRLWLFATLHGSRVLFITIEGDMGLLVGWGNDPNFVISVGGFHPAYSPPALPFPNPRRIAISILDTSVARIRVEAYFAVTSNTVQFGARAELYFGISVASVEGHLAFDALIQFSPFYFIISVSASLSVKLFGLGFFSISISVSLEGPTPWRIKGKGKIKFLFFSVSIPIDVTWGDSQDTLLPPIEIFPLLEEQIDDTSNWTAELAASSSLLVSLREISSSTELVLHPVGTLRVSQRKMPLDLTLDKLGNRSTADVSKVSITSNTAGFAKLSDVTESFAIGEFQDLDDSSRLSRPGFENQHSGIIISAEGAQLKSGRSVKRNIRYESLTIDTNYKQFVHRFFTWIGSLFVHMLGGNAVTRSTLSKKSQLQRQPFIDVIEVSSNSYAVANMSDNKAFDPASTFESEALAREYMQTQIQAQPNLQQDLHVIPQSELQEVGG